MPETFNSALITEKNTLRNIHPWAWLVEIDLDGTNGMRVAGHDESVSYASKTWSPFPIAVTSLPRDLEGSVPQFQIGVSNLSREIATYLDSGGIIDRKVHLYAVNTNTLTTSQDWGEMTVQSCDLTLEVAAFILGPYNLFDAPYPPRIQTRTRCDKIYGGAECLYSTSLPNLVSGTYPSFSTSSCDYTLEGSNGCRVHGHNEVANGRPRLHPRLFGAFRGIPKGPARI